MSDGGQATMSPGDPAPDRHAVRRVRREPKRRTLQVVASERLTPSLLRLNFASPELHDFESDGADDHVKLFVPAGPGEPPVMRDYTPRAFDTAAGTLVIDFALHEAGPATLWALSAKRGDTIQIGGPRGSTIVPDDYDWYLLIGDETALPAIGRRLEALRPAAKAIVLAVVDGEADRLALTSPAALATHWALRSDGPGDDGARLIRALDGVSLPAGEGFVWIAAEARAARALRVHVIDTLGHPKAWVKASGYWSAGAAGAHEKIGD